MKASRQKKTAVTFDRILFLPSQKNAFVYIDPHLVVSLHQLLFLALYKVILVHFFWHMIFYVVSYFCGVADGTELAFMLATKIHN